MKTAAKKKKQRLKIKLRKCDTYRAGYQTDEWFSWRARRDLYYQMDIYKTVELGRLPSFHPLSVSCPPSLSLFLFLSLSRCPVALAP